MMARASGLGRFLDFQTLSPRARFIRITAMLLALLSFLGLVSSARQLVDQCSHLAASRSFIYNIAVIVESHGALLITWLLTSVVFVVDRTHARRDSDDISEVEIGMATVLKTLDYPILKPINDIKTQVDAENMVRDQDIVSVNPSQREAGLYNRAVNTMLVDWGCAEIVGSEAIKFKKINNPWKAYDAEDYKGKSTQSILKNYVLQKAIRNNRKVFNDKKVRLRTDLKTGMQGPLMLQETDYVSSLMTDQIALKQIKKQSTEMYLSDLVKKFIVSDENGQGKRLARFADDEDCANNIGISALAFSSDGALVIVRQTMGNSQNPGRLVPSGSGSLDWVDIDRVGSDSFLHLLRYGAARELIEECGLAKLGMTPEGLSQAMLVFGYCRLIHRAGKPEFFAVTRLNRTAEEINAAQVSRSERRYTDKSVRVKRHWVDWAAGETRIASGISALCDHFLSEDIDIFSSESSHNELVNLSFQLYQGLLMLKQTIRDRPFLVKFLMECHASRT